jgi:hypothetical protein
MVYTYVLGRAQAGVRSPVDRLLVQPTFITAPAKVPLPRRITALRR